jgi:hypothetical protein
MVWVKQGDGIHPTGIVTGAADGKLVEVTAGLRAGELVVVAMSAAEKNTATSAATATTTTNPFLPKRPGGGGPPGH